MMLQEEIDADPKRWKALRRSGVTASEIAAILGLAPATQNSAWKVYAAKTTGEHFDADTDETLRGTHLEPYVAARFREDYPELNVITGGLYAARERPWQMATFDRLAYQQGMTAPWTAFPVQIKTAVNKYHDGNLVWGDPGSPDIPVQYRAQCLWELDVADASEILIPCLFMDTWKLVTYRIERDADAKADIEAMRAAGEEFLNRLHTEDPPPVDWTPATTAALKTLYKDEPDGSVAIPVKLARRYRDAKAAEKRAKRRVGLATNQILDLAGNAKYITVGQRGRYRLNDDRVASRSVSNRTSYDHDMLRKKFPKAAKACERKTPVSALHPGRWTKTLSDVGDE
jgi:putative phage-type endonuclease